MIVLFRRTSIVKFNGYRRFFINRISILFFLLMHPTLKFLAI